MKQSQSHRSGALYALYHTSVGRIMLKALTAPPLSGSFGAFLDSPASVRLIVPFVKRTGIDLSDYEQRPFCSFNDFFTRRLASGARSVDFEPQSLIAPCDGLLSVYPVRRGAVYPVKGVPYTLAGLLRSHKLAAHFDGGLCLVYRLCVDNYHRYAFFDDGRLLRRYRIDGVLHTVRPAALEARPVFVENCREVSLMRTAHFGFAAQIEVGAMLVGRICNRRGVTEFVRGDEKGWFEYGGSTVVVLLQKGAARLSRRFLAAEEEIPVRYGERIGVKAEAEQPGESS